MTGRCAYESALSLINERDSNGEFHQDTQDYEKNLPILLELCVAQLWYDDCIVRGVSPKNFRYTSEKRDCRYFILAASVGRESTNGIPPKKA
jgi:hypothetical protein